MENLISIVIQANDHASSILKSITGSLDGIGMSMVKAGGALTAATAPLALGLAAATRSAITFDETMTNVGAILGRNREEMAELNAEILKIGSASRAGPQASAEAFAEIAGGVEDASTHMAILDAAISASEAGAASLTGTTSALVAVMNSYGFAADKASFVSDVLTQTVGMGVGSMDELAASMPQVAGIAAQVGISFDELGASMAFLSTKGFTFSESATAVRQAIVAVLTPNAKMLELFQKAGIASGEASLKTHGLAGTYELLSRAAGGSTDVMSGAVGSVQALNAALALGQDAFTGFNQAFMDTTTGATEAARAIQEGSTAFQLDKLRSGIQGIGITIGTVLLPPLNDLVVAITPIVQGIVNWMQEHQSLTRALVLSAAALVTIGPLLVTLGTSLLVISKAGAVLSGLKLGATLMSIVNPVKLLGVALAALTSPIGLVVAGGALLATVLGVDLVGGIRSVIDAVGVFQARLKEKHGDILKTLRSMFLADEDGSNVFSSILEGFGMAREQAQEWGAKVGEVANFILTSFDAVGKALQGDMTAVQQAIINGLGVSPEVAEAATRIIDAFVTPIRNLKNDIQITLSLIPFYAEYYFNAVRNTIQTQLINPLIGLWEFAKPFMEPIIDWFENEFQATLERVSLWVNKNVINPLLDIYHQARPYLLLLQTVFEVVMGKIGEAIAPIITEINNFIGKVGDLALLAQTIWSMAGRLGSGWTPEDTVANNKGETKSKPVYGGIGKVTDLIGPATSSFPPLADPFGNVISFGGYRATGGSVIAGMLYGVNELGTEGFVPNISGTIIPLAPQIPQAAPPAGYDGGYSAGNDGAVHIHGPVYLNLPEMSDNVDPDEFAQMVYRVLVDLAND